MKASPQITADLEDYPELGTLVRQSVRRIAELMELHDIADLRRIRKTGVFGRPYAKDTVRAIGVKSVPTSITASRQTVGKVLLDYLETIGIGGLTLEFDEADAMTLAELWAPQGCRIRPKTVAAKSAVPPGTTTGPVPAATPGKPNKPTKSGGKDKTTKPDVNTSH